MYGDTQCIQLGRIQVGNHRGERNSFFHVGQDHTLGVTMWSPWSEPYRGYMFSVQVCNKITILRNCIPIYSNMVYQKGRLVNTNKYSRFLCGHS